MKRVVIKLLFNRWSAFLHDMLLIPIALLFSLWLRFNLGEIPEDHLVSVFRMLVVAIPVQSVFFWSSGMYRGFWRFASIPDLIRILKSVVVGTLVVILVDSLVFRLEDVPRSVLLLYPIMLTAALMFPRVIYRWIKDSHFELNRQEGQRTLIIGAGHAGELLLRDLIHRPEYQPVAFLDDNSKVHGREIHGVRVLGNLDDLGVISKRLSVEVALFAIPSAGRNLIQRVVRECAKLNLQCRTLPTIVELSDRVVDVDRLRPITVDDLLGREAVKLDTLAIAGYLKGKRIMVTGGGGSIGSELCRQIAKLEPGRLIVLEHSEYNLYCIEQELLSIDRKLRLEGVLGDVKNRERVEWAFGEYRPEVVFHAAAYKHVPMLERNPAEGVSNNIFGTGIVADAADRFGAERFVMVSTDKAVNPANVMGTTKRVAEIYCQNLDSRSNTRYITTRFGNVLGSTGSVVPLFEEQIRNGGPVTVTHPEITRYFMTIPEAVGLVLQAGSMGKGGEIFVLEMGEAVLIRELAEQMIRLSGLEPGKDIQIVFNGLRPGEKLHEQIFHEEENLRGTTHPKLRLSESRHVDWDWLSAEMKALKDAAQSRDVITMIEHLRNLVPEYSVGPEVSAVRQDSGGVKLRVVKGGSG
ncbi:MAG: nucleoside-diphosphate sugar epimerase/dehydratase [Thermodesulfobacteriota bacterium]|nr:nucleoside-diphosphate sugar epimerase/dehydratase [Thermodesulfobacteriota bacterium]